MNHQEKRLDRERKTICLMIQIYCKHHHQASLCEECQQLTDYAMNRIDKCRFKSDKPTCAKCPVHCYQAKMREKIRQVMRFSGPRMLLWHPILTVWHYVDEFKNRNKTYEIKPRR